MRSENALKWKLDNILHWNKFTQNQAIKRWLCKNQVHYESANWVTFFLLWLLPGFALTILQAITWVYSVDLLMIWWWWWTKMIDVSDLWCELTENQPLTLKQANLFRNEALVLHQNICNHYMSKWFFFLHQTSTDLWLS